MDWFIPDAPRMKRDRSKPRKDKHLLVDEDVVDGQISPDNLLKDYLDSQAGGSSGEQFNLDGLFEFDFDTTQITLRSVTLIKRGSDVVLRDRIHKELGKIKSSVY